MNPRLLTRSLLVFLPLLCCSLLMFAQTEPATAQFIVKGKIMDGKTSKPLPGATVRVKNGTQSALTDEQGGFTIKVPSPESILTITYVGYVVFETRAGISGNLNVVLNPAGSQLDDVVVVGYGTKKRTDVLGAISTIKGEVIEDLPVANLGTALKNRLPGVGISVASGKPGATTSLNIRNATTLSGGNLLGSQDPLYVIDGITLTKTDFDNLDASLVESITFLKDAAAAIYGAAGAKGVVLITTKKGKVGKPTIAYSGSYGVSTISDKAKVLDPVDHAIAINDGYEAQNFPSTTPKFSPADLDSIRAHHYSWFDELWTSSSVTRHTMNVSGGTDKITFFAGGNYYHETGNLRDLYITKYGIRAGMNAKVSNSVSASVAVNTDYTQNERPTYKPDQTDLSDQTMRALLLTPGWVPLQINGLPVYYATAAWNPLALFNSGTYNRTKDQGLTLNASLDFRPTFIKGLTARVQFGKSNRQGTGKEYYVAYNTYDFNKYGNNSQLYSNVVSATKKITNTDRLFESLNYANSYQLIGSLTYARRFGLHDISVLIAAEQAESDGDSYSVYRDGQVIPGVDQFFGFTQANTNLGIPTPYEAGKRSYLSRVNYSFKDRYLLEGIARYDASANFPPDRRWGLFPSVGLGWKVSEEDFFRNNVSFINTLKIRANLGLVGDDRIRNYQYVSRFSQTQGILLGGGLSNGLDNNLIPNPYITWEKAFTQNYGADATFLKTKMNVSVDVWKRHTYDMLVSPTTALPFTAGADAAAQNYGSIDSWGIEASIGYRDNINKDFSYFVDANFGSSSNALVRTFQQVSWTGTYQDAIGQPTGRVDGYIAKDILRTQDQVDAILSKNPNYTISGQKPRVGFLDFEDVNNDGKIDGNDITKLRTRASSLFGMGFTLGVTYKTLRLSTNLNLAVGGYVYYDAIAKTPPSLTQSAAAFWKDHWTPSNPNAAFPLFDAPLAKETSTFWERPGTQMRVNNMTLSYAMPRGLAERLHIPEFRAYLSGMNLWNIINPFDYKDPSNSNFINYPMLRSYSLGINMTL